MEKQMIFIQGYLRSGPVQRTQSTSVDFSCPTPLYTASTRHPIPNAHLDERHIRVVCIITVDYTGCFVHTSVRRSAFGRRCRSAGV